jgi:hypothetical protein
MAHALRATSDRGSRLRRPPHLEVIMTDKKAKVPKKTKAAKPKAAKA